MILKEFLVEKTLGFILPNSIIVKKNGKVIKIPKGSKINEEIIQLLIENNISKISCFKIQSNEIHENFAAEKISDSETLRIIKDFFVNYGFILDPHTATAVGASYKFKNKSKTIILGTAHPYKFLDTIKLAIGKNVDPPKQFLNLSEKVEKFEIIDNKLENIKKYIIDKIR